MMTQLSPALAPVQAHAIAREIVQAVSPYGDFLRVEVSSCEVRDVKRSIEKHLVGLQVHTIKQNGVALRDFDMIDADEQVEFTYLLQGGGASVNFVKDIPDALSIRILMYKCGIQNLPDMSDWWCKNKCCCIHHECGIKEFWMTQFFCVKCCGGPLPAPSVSGPQVVSGFPELLTLSCLCFTCGIENFPDFAKEDWCEGYMCCCFQNCGPKDCLNILQILCFKLTC